MRLIVCLDFPPIQAHPKVIASYRAAAERWGAEFIRFEERFCDRHCYQQKLLLGEVLHTRYGSCDVLQLDNDMLIAHDCPDPFARLLPGKIGCVRYPHRKEDWFERNHLVWSARLDLRPAPPQLHPNGGTYLYNTDFWMTHVAPHVPRALLFSRHECADEGTIATACAQKITWLPHRFNWILARFPHLANRRQLSGGIFHFMGKRAKGWIDWYRWQAPTRPPRRSVNAT